MTSTKKSIKPPLLVFRGSQEQAIYHDEISIYQGNPLIEALPEIKTEDDIIKELEFYPEFLKEERNLPAHQRLHLIQNVLELFIVLSPHLDLEQRFSRMLRSGYIARNPVSRGYWKDINKKVETLRSGSIANRRRRSTATGFTILGISGVGKSTTVQAILNLYPQVIYHNRYRNQNHTNTQLVWLILECPADGSIKGLCLNFFQAVDDILGTSYYKNYANNGRKTVNELMPYMALAASNVHLGVLVIDEIQRLTKLNVGGYEKILDFFVQLINTIGLPVVLVGTYKAWSVLGSEFRQIRRGTGQGDFIWDRMKEDEDWEIFADALWQYQYIHKPCQRTPELSHALYYECQGITDFAIKVFMLAQVRAISTGKEKLTVGIIKSVAKDCLRTAREVLDALKIGNVIKLRNCEDVNPINIDEFIEEEQQQLSVNDLLPPFSEPIESLVNHKVEQQEQVKQQKCDFLNTESITEPTNASTRSQSKTGRSSKKRSRKTASEGDLALPEIVIAGKRCSITAYEALEEAGYIQPITEYFLEIVH